jgi:hypothetical protein
MQQMLILRHIRHIFNKHETRNFQMSEFAHFWWFLQFLIPIKASLGILKKFLSKKGSPYGKP